ncbi:NADPH-dependent FMN reductase [Nakamurella leprariae]|uniref:NAD(P)H-dependent oxidoreductase n=1 Tax=Nakamurella leprariae TaxID=2803911 RepID=A0A939C2X2_9ACTN|nr:NAD(P)H-dependent oxidoreductase [Nakamurella leprariae]MBM9468759.1 NAD(P)H-dependent oxidoreductase [Nakamurella leprariae]
MTPVLQVVVGSVRPGRVGPAVGDWIAGHPAVLERFTVQTVDVADLGLPLLDEPELPRMGRYRQAHTRRWSELAGRADAFLFVTPEYNLAPPASLTNAIDYLHREWWFKAAAIVSYGGRGGGLRSAQLLRQILGAVSTFVVHESVSIHHVAARITDHGRLDAPPEAAALVGPMVESLALLAGALGAVRTPPGVPATAVPVS